MSLIPATAVPFTGEDFTIDQSLKFEPSRDPTLTRTFGTSTSLKKFTFSCWFKRSNVEASVSWRNIFSVGTDGNNYAEITFHTLGYFYIHDYKGGYKFRYYRSNNLYRDPSAWMHLVVAVDTTQSTASQRVRIYFNGDEITTWNAEDNPVLNSDLGWFGDDSEHTIGAQFTETGANFDGYLAELHYIDGTQYAPTDFGETGTYGEWKPIEVSGLTYGNNGFYLPFKQDYTVEGFSAVTYKSSYPSPQYIGGVGFQPDFLWIKSRASAGSHNSYDSIRGAGYGITSNSTAAEYYSNTQLTSFDSDGFTLPADTAGYNNYSSKDYVAWAWDMGGGSTPYDISVNGNIKHSTTQNKIGTTSIYHDGTGHNTSGGNHIRATNLYSLGDNWTIEAWIYPTASNTRMFCSHGNNNDNDKLEIDHGGANPNVRLWIGGSKVLDFSTSGSPITINTWNHLAITRNNGTMTIWVDGTSEATATYSGIWPTHTQGLDFGIRRSGSTYWEVFHGYMDEIRISKIARYTSSFTPSTSAFTDDTNTTYLVHSNTSNNSTTFVDSSGAEENTDGSIDSRVKANPTYGQSIVRWNGDGNVDNGGSTVGHGLSSAPEMIIFKRVSQSMYWYVYHTGMTSNYYEMYLNDNNAETAGGYFQNGVPSSTVFTTYDGGQTTHKNIAYCFHSVTGYSKFGSYTGNGSTTGATQTCGFKPAFVLIKCSSHSSDWRLWDNTRNPESGTALKHLLPNSSAAENTSLGIEFLDTGFKCKSAHSEINASGFTYIYAAFADTREYAYWLDQSGNNNDWTSNNLTESDISVDSPTNNFATMNPNDIHNNFNLSEGNLKIYNGDSGTWASARGTFSPTSGKWYFELVIPAIWNYGHVGLLQNTYRISQTDAYENAGSWTYQFDGRTHTNNVETNASLPTLNSGDIVQTAYDVDAGKLWWGVNNTWLLSGDPAAGSNEVYSGITGDVSPHILMYSSPTTGVVMNFGADSSFAGNKTAQGNQDENGYGDFYYEPPSGYKALCTANLPEPAVIPSEHFNTVLYTGTGSSNAITGVGFEPDMSWFKRRDSTGAHALADSIRGDSAVLYPSETDSEYTQGGEGFLSLDSDGFTVDGGGGGGSVNVNNGTYVAWDWKANGSGSSNTTGSINSTVSANTDAGFSISTYTGTGSNATVGHGLSKAPEMVIVKCRSNSGDWAVYRTDLGAANNMRLHSSAAVYAASTMWNSTASTATVFSIGTNGDVNSSGRTYVAYAFHSVEGYSKVGSHTGNGSANGNFLYTGFRPAWVMFKDRDAANGWAVLDNKRNAFNLVDEVLTPNSTDATYDYDSGIDFVSNGIKLRSANGKWNDNNAPYIWIAFAETPFKYANAR